MLLTIGKTTGEMPKTMADLNKLSNNDNYSSQSQDLSIYTYKLTDLKNVIMNYVLL